MLTASNLMNSANKAVDLIKEVSVVPLKYFIDWLTSLSWHPDMYVYAALRSSVLEDLPILTVEKLNVQLAAEIPLAVLKAITLNFVTLLSA